MEIRFKNQWLQAINIILESESNNYCSIRLGICRVLKTIMATLVNRIYYQTVIEELEYLMNPELYGIKEIYECLGGEPISVEGCKYIKPAFKSRGYSVKGKGFIENFYWFPIGEVEERIKVLYWLKERLMNM